MTAKRIPSPEVLNQETGHDLMKVARDQELHKGDTLLIDLSKTRTMDTRGGAWMLALAELAHARGGELKWEGETGDVAQFMELVEPGLKAALRKKPRREGYLEHFGGVMIDVAGEAREFGNLLVDAIYWTLMAPFEGRGFRWGLLLDEMHEMGVRAVRINFLMNFLLGLTIAMLSAAQLRTFGLEIYVADLVMIGFARELAAIMTAVVVAARTGAAIAAELATMKVQEEIDALRGMGLNVPQFLVAPKLLALVLVMPCLVVLGMLSGIAGGMLWGVLVLDIQPDAWLKETLNAAKTDDIMQGLTKGFFFAIIIVLVGCHNGLRVEGGSRGVGLMTTRAVVMDIFLIITVDMLFALLFYYVLE